MYLKITNKGGNDRILWELVGATKKYADGKTIGFKGSGAKFAPIPALRLGIEFVITSIDDIGPYTLTYKTVSVGDYDRIVLDYNNGEIVKETSFVTNAVKDWDMPIIHDNLRTFKLLREVITNAYDEDKNFTLSRVRKISPPKKGETSVYLGWHQEFRFLFPRKNEIDLRARYFKFLAKEEPVDMVDYFWNYTGMPSTKGIVRFYQRSDDELSRIFINGVLIHCFELKSAFDYCVNDQDLLSEERILKNESMLLWHIKNGLSESFKEREIPKKVLPLLKEKIGLERRAICDSNAADTNDFRRCSQETLSLWQNTWAELSEKRPAIIGNRHTSESKDIARMGYDVLDLSTPVNVFLESRGIKSVVDISKNLSELNIVAVEELTESETKVFKEALNIFKEVYPGAAEQMPTIRFFAQRKRTKDGDWDGQSIRINVAALREGLLHTLAVIAHEYRHFSSEAPDYDRDFEQAADDIIAELLLKVFELSSVSVL